MEQHWRRPYTKDNESDSIDDVIALGDILVATTSFAVGASAMKNAGGPLLTLSLSR